MEKEAQDEKSRLELTVKFIKNGKATDKEQRFTDAKTPGLTLAVKPVTTRKKDGSKLWRFRYLLNGTAKMISLGEYPTVSLKEARDALMKSLRRWIMAWTLHKSDKLRSRPLLSRPLKLLQIQNTVTCGKSVSCPSITTTFIIYLTTIIALETDGYCA